MNDDYFPPSSVESEGYPSKDVSTKQKRPLPVTEVSYRKFVLWGILTGVLLALVILFFAPLIRESMFIISNLRRNDVHSRNRDELLTKRQEFKALQNSINRLRNRYEGFLPRKPYLIVNTTDNWIYLKEGSRIIHEGPCSTGSYTLLKSRDNRHWVFKTPRGLFRVQLKLVRPVWRMPDWAFIEEGRAVPAPDAPERFDEGALGRYALGIGKGYLIHGTLYKRLLGMPVTHGCVRLDDPELIQVYNHLGYGAKVFIY